MRMLRLLTLLVFAPTVLAQSADLRVSLTMPSTAFFNGSYTFAAGTLTISNAGNVPAQDVSFDFGGGLGPSSLPYQGVKCSGPNFTHCTVPSIVPGTWTLPIFADWSYEMPAGTVKTSTVTVSSASTPDPDYTNNTTSAQTTILWQADLTLDSLNVPSPVAAGTTAAIDASFSNHGPSPATDLSLTISIPPGARYEGYFGEWWLRCKEPTVGGSGDLVCTTSSVGNFTNGASVEALVSVDPTLAPGSVLPVNAALTSTTATKSPLTASGSLIVAAPVPAPDAAVTVTATFDNPSVVTGHSAWETYTVSNAGPRDAEIVTLDIRPPNGYASWVGHPSLGSCDGNGPIHCTMATLPAGGTMTLQVLVQTYFGSTGTFTSTAVATWLHGGSAVTSNTLVVTPLTPPRRRSTRH